MVLISCNLQTADEIRNDGYANLLGGHYLYDTDFEYIDNPGDSLDEKIKKIVTNIVLPNINYVEIDKLILAGPKEIWERGWADCDGYAITLQNILYFELGIEAGMALYYHTSSVLDSASKVIVNGGRVNHAVICIGNNYYEAQTGDRIYPASIGYLYSFRFVFSGSFALNLLN